MTLIPSRSVQYPAQSSCAGNQAPTVACLLQRETLGLMGVKPELTENVEWFDIVRCDLPTLHRFKEKALSCVGPVDSRVLS